MAWIAGRNIASGTLEESANPTSYATTANSGIGFMAMNDEFQVHVKSSITAGGTLGLADNQCVIVSGATYSAEWVIIPTQRPDFWDFVNACRRIRGVNFTLSHQFAFLRAPSLNSIIINQIRYKSANVVAAHLNDIDGVKAHGTLFQKYLEQYPDVYARHNDRVRYYYPDVKPLVYFHCHLDNSNPEDLAAYVNDRTLLPDGTQATYGGGERPRIFFPTAGNKWGEAMAKNIDSILGVAAGDCKADGVYWDGFNFASLESKYHYGDPWDNISGDIDENTGALLRRKSSTLLLSREWIVSQIQRIMRQGMLSNSQPHIRSIYNLHFQSFQESGSASNYARALLYSPVLLGDHKTEAEFIDAYRGMVKALNYGCLYNWYGYTIMPTYETLTKYMFPITPIELREGYIIGEERIVTNRSGTYGWGDKSFHQVHVYGSDGREMSNVQPSTRTTKRIGGNTYTVLNLAEYETATIIRRPGGLPWLNLFLGN